MFFNSLPAVNVTDVMTKLSEPNVTFIDVRTAGEYAMGHAAGAKNVPLDTFDDSVAVMLKDYAAVYVICQSGGRSAAATEELIANGVKAINVKGGTSAWVAAGLPMGN